ncbi:MAG: beta-galactosidase GalA [Gemmatimonadales bacterium]
MDRRDVLKAGLAAAASSLLSPRASSLFRLGGTQTVAPRERLLFDFGWRFALGHASDPARDFGYGEGEMFSKAGRVFAPSRPNFDVGAWRAVDLPHDWAVELPFENAKELIEFGCKPLGRNYPATSVGWYRKTFDIPASDAGRRIAIDFDGVFRDCLVALNGNLLGGNRSGYAPFRFDVTDYITYGGSNVLVVRVDATGRDGWFYEGAGIYRHVWLEKTNAVHVAHWGSFVTTQLSGGRAIATAVTELENEQGRAVAAEVRVAVGGAVATGRVDIPAFGRATVTRQLALERPAVWSADAPHMYTAATTVSVGGREVDRVSTRFGVRSVHFEVNDGFLLNGRRVEIKGTCNHQDHAGVGSALPDRLQYYRIERLKAMGSNAYRTSHNPPTPELLDACDALGMLVLDETRFFSSDPEGAGQFERMVRRDRNHPSILAWSIANEEFYEQGTDHGRRIAESLVRLAHTLDPSRPVTAAMNSSWGKGISLAVDVQGCNYERPQRPESNLDAYHAAHPAQPMLGTEVASTFSTRGIYANDPERGYMSAYDVNKPNGYGATAEEWWTRFDARRWLAGGFVWTGFDYRGEPSPYAWPCISSHFGIMDTCGFAKDNFYYYKAWWGGGPVLHVFPHWTWPGREGQPVEVWVHSNLDRVELVLNGRSLGAKPVVRDGHLAWSVPYEPGTLVARGYKEGSTTPALEDSRTTAGPAVAIVVNADRTRIRADGEDLAVITVSAVDEKGIDVPSADNEISFALGPAGRLIGVGNGDPSSHESDKGTTRKLFNGLCAAFVQAGFAPGDLRVEATSPGLRAAAVTLTLDPASRRAWL